MFGDLLTGLRPKEGKAAKAREEPSVLGGKKKGSSALTDREPPQKKRTTGKRGEGRSGSGAVENLPLPEEREGEGA